ncbi:MAG: NfeD family protein [Eubacteriales bacterium]|nr:NfeD family protein [Eubacteriales bacterium]
MSGAIYVISWLLLAAIFIVAEIISLGLTTIWFAGGAIVAALAALAGASLVVQIVLFVAISVVLLISTRPLAHKFLDGKTEKTNVEALIGKKAVVTEEIHNLGGTGKATINGMEWTARSVEDSKIIPAGVSAQVAEIQGVKLILRYEGVADGESQETLQTNKEQVDDIQIV